MINFSNDKPSMHFFLVLEGILRRGPALYKGSQTLYTLRKLGQYCSPSYRCPIRCGKLKMMRHLCVCDFSLFYVQTRLYLDDHPLLVDVEVFCLKVFFIFTKIILYSGNLFLVSCLL